MENGPLYLPEHDAVVKVENVDDRELTVRISEGKFKGRSITVTLRPKDKQHAPFKRGDMFQIRITLDEDPRIKGRYHNHATIKARYAP